MFVAVYLPGNDHMKGFESSDAAWDWIAENRICELCKEEVAAGGFWIGSGDEKEWVEIEHGSQTACAAEWMVVSEEEYIEAGENSRGVLQASFEKAQKIKPGEIT